ncbi:MAG: protein-L-isoaspartate O-methyltransferase [Candidatus Omnitrophota bacterium]
MKITNILLKSTVIISLFLNNAGQACALRPPASDSNPKAVIASLTPASDSEKEGNIDPKKLLSILGRPKETAVIGMTNALASDGKKYISSRALKLFYPASGWDMSAVIVALLLIDKDAIDYAELYMVDVSVSVDSTIKSADKIRPFVEDFEVKKEEGTAIISMRYKGRPITMSFYYGDDEEVIKKLPKDMNLLYYHAHGIGGYMPNVFRPIWEAFIKHCEVPVVIFSYAFPEPLIELTADWEYRTREQFDRWHTVIPMYSGGVAFGLEPPVDLELIKNVWDGFPIKHEEYATDIRIPTENIDKLIIQRSLKKLSKPVDGLHDRDRELLIAFFKRDTLAFDEWIGLQQHIFPIRDYFDFIHHPSGLHREISMHGVAANLRHYGIDLDQPPEQRLKQLKDKIKDRRLSVAEKTSLLRALLFVGGDIDASSIADIYESADSRNEISQIEMAFLGSQKNLSGLHSRVYDELARRVIKAGYGRAIRHYIKLFMEMSELEREDVFKKHPKARKRLFIGGFLMLCDYIRNKGINFDSYMGSIQIADWLAQIDLDRTLKYAVGILATSSIFTTIGPKNSKSAKWPMIYALNNQITKKTKLTKNQKRTLDFIMSRRWPIRLSERKLQKHIRYRGNAELYNHLYRIFKDSPAAKNIIDCMRITPRHLFLFPYMKEWAYMDVAMPVMNEQTISQPRTVVDMLSPLELKEGDSVLEIGTGTGWNAAIMSRQVGESGHIYSVEIDRELAEFAVENLGRLNIGNVTVYGGEDGSMGLPEKVPFDAIIFTCGVPIPMDPDAGLDRFKIFTEDIGRQLKIGGRMVFPLTFESGEGIIELGIKKSEDEWETKPIGPVKFVPMKGRYGHGSHIKRVESMEPGSSRPLSFQGNKNIIAAIGVSA